MKQGIKRILSLCLCLSVLLGLALPAGAEYPDAADSACRTDPPGSARLLARAHRAAARSAPAAAGLRPASQGQRLRRFASK